jgi:hypothetical protein
VVSPVKWLNESIFKKGSTVVAFYFAISKLEELYQIEEETALSIE